MLNGSYSVIFQSQLGRGSGIFILSNTKILGGDSHAFYSGFFKQKNNAIHLSLTTNLHTPPRGAPILFARDKMMIDFSGTVDGETIQLEGNSLDMPGVLLKADLRLLQSL